ncbi:MAG: SUMF1/EgtB/PvdO family nonheme iron enzyme [Myxococcales bacterium]|nr:SUMF1/EgtB/PvdO family nonheme iron enzyme [Myxococcales bacterium]
MDYGDVSPLVSVRNPLEPTQPIRIDATEVTQGQYQRFLEATNGGAEVSGQPTYCAWNTTYAPGTECFGPRVAEILACDVRPQTCVDWCDAYMYCQWVGKRLCGRIRDGVGHPLVSAATLNDEWYVACSSGQQYAYSPGSSDEVYKCNTLDCFAAQSCTYSPGQTRIVPPGSMPDCQSPSDNYHGVYDLTGNIWEWTNACDGSDGPDDICAYRGGSISHGGSGVRCDVIPNRRTRSYQSSEVGFRCCADPE